MSLDVMCRWPLSPMTLRLDMPPIGQGRHRSFARLVKGKIFSGQYTPEKTSNWKNEAVKLMRRQVGAPMLLGALRVDIVAVFHRPERMMTKRWENKREYHTSKPDKDNVEKIVMDALQKAGVLRDDCIVCAGETSKWYADRVETPHVEITITWLGEIAA